MQPFSTMGQTDRRTPYRCIDPARYYASSVNNAHVQGDYDGKIIISCVF